MARYDDNGQNHQQRIMMILLLLVLGFGAFYFAYATRKKDDPSRETAPTTNTSAATTKTSTSAATTSSPAWPSSQLLTNGTFAAPAITASQTTLPDTVPTGWRREPATGTGTITLVRNGSGGALSPSTVVAGLPTQFVQLGAANTGILQTVDRNINPDGTKIYGLHVTLVAPQTRDAAKVVAYIEVRNQTGKIASEEFEFSWTDFAPSFFGLGATFKPGATDTAPWDILIQNRSTTGQSLLVADAKLIECPADSKHFICKLPPPPPTRTV